MPRARTTDPQTSHSASASVRQSTVRRLRLLIIQILEDNNKPMSDEEIYGYIDWLTYEPVSPSSFRTRRSELVDRGVVRAADRKGVTAAGRACTRWELTPQQQLSMEE